ncbi:MAG: hypothetical protein M3X11_20920 [Acidobacteriota bacterium]|nr:hypothetical protein [Acidobacteriota bacterium]
MKLLLPDAPAAFYVSNTSQITLPLGQEKDFIFRCVVSEAEVAIALEQLTVGTQCQSAVGKTAVLLDQQDVLLGWLKGGIAVIQS